MYQNTLFLEPFTKRGNGQPLRASVQLQTSDVCRGSIAANSVRTTSTLRTFRLECTKWRSLCAVVRYRCCDPSKDRGERTKSEYLAVTSHLPDKVSNAKQQ